MNTRHTLPTPSFHYRLRLQENQIAEIEDGSFLGLDRLKILDLSTNRLQELRSEMFQGLPECTNVLLNQNEITRIRVSEGQQKANRNYNTIFFIGN